MILPLIIWLLAADKVPATKWWGEALGKAPSSFMDARLCPFLGFRGVLSYYWMMLAVVPVEGAPPAGGFAWIILWWFKGLSGV